MNNVRKINSIIDWIESLDKSYLVEKTGTKATQDNLTYLLDIKFDLKESKIVIENYKKEIENLKLGE